MSDTPQTDECVKENRHIRFLQEDHYVGTDKYTYENPIVFLCQKLERERDEAIAEATNAVNMIEPEVAFCDLEGGVRWKLNSLVEACQNLIDVQGPQNTDIAFNKMKCILESITN